MSDFFIKALVWPLVLLVCFALLLVWLAGRSLLGAAWLLHVVGNMLAETAEDDLS